MRILQSPRLDVTRGGCRARHRACARHRWMRGYWHNVRFLNYCLLHLLITRCEPFTYWTLSSAMITVINLPISTLNVLITHTLRPFQDNVRGWNVTWKTDLAALSVEIFVSALFFFFFLVLFRCHLWSQSQSHLSSGSLGGTDKTLILHFSKENPTLSFYGIANTLILQTLALSRSLWHFSWQPEMRYEPL